MDGPTGVAVCAGSIGDPVGSSTDGELADGPTLTGAGGGLTGGSGLTQADSNAPTSAKVAIVVVWRAVVTMTSSGRVRPSPPDLSGDRGQH